MFKLNFIDMPDEYTQLLRVDMQTSSRHFTGLQSYILKRPSLCGILNRILNKGEEVDINAHMKTLGWHGVRDRILSYYLYFMEYKEHPNAIDITSIDDILGLERELRFSTISGYSRIILYCFFLKLSSMEDGYSDYTEHPFYPNETIVNLLKDSNERTVNVDYLIILLHHLIEFFGEEKLRAFIGENFSYESIYLKLSEDQKELLCENFLAYAGSIGEREIFGSQIV